MIKKTFNFLFLLFFFSISFLFFSVNQIYADVVTCGQEYPPTIHTCDCSHSEPMNQHTHCCGWVEGQNCLASDPAAPADDDVGDDDDGADLSPIDDPVTAADLDLLNPLLIEGIEGSEHAETLSTPTGIISRILVFAFPLAGLILFLMIVWGGFEMLSGAAGKKGLEAGKQRVTAAIIGFLLLFASYWIVQIMERVFGVDILGTPGG